MKKSSNSKVLYMGKTIMITPTRAVQSFIDAKKSGLEPSPEVLEVIKTYRKWRELELIGLRNASAYYPDIYFEENMDETIESLLKAFKAREVPHKF